MYIAFKWLVVFAFAMWISLCCIEELAKLRRSYVVEVIENSPYPNNRTEDDQESICLKKAKLHLYKYQKGRDVDFHYLMFLAGALAVTVFNKKSEIIWFTKKNVAIMYVRTLKKYEKCHDLYKFREFNLYKTASVVWVAMYKIITILWEFWYRYLSKKFKYYRTVQRLSELAILLLKKLKKTAKERDNYRRLLLATIQVNTHIRTQYLLEKAAKNRLMKHLDTTQNEMRTNRAHYVNFQQLYLMTHQENMFFKARIKKLVSEKIETDEKLMELINEIFISDCEYLKAYCSTVMVNAKINPDMNTEEQKLLKIHRTPAACTTNWHLTNCSNAVVTSSRSLPSTRMMEIIPHEEDLLRYYAAPKLRGLPGEYIWTIKDKNGIIEKLYEYDYGYECEGNDTIRRIREYSVYHDKDCLLDSASSSRTALPNCSGHYAHVKMLKEFPTTQRFLTDSEAFQSFLKNNKNVVVSRVPLTSW